MDVEFCVDIISAGICIVYICIFNSKLIPKTANGGKKLVD
jgi:hypothetical protein